jgi:hypothetical protein
MNEKIIPESLDAMEVFLSVMATSFSGRRSRSTQREPPTMGKQLVNFITCSCGKKIKNEYLLKFLLLDMGIGNFFSYAQNK